MKTKVKKWGNSLAIRIPKKLADTYDLKENKVVELLTDEKGVIKLQSVVDKKTDRTDWRKYLIPSNKPLENVSENIDQVVYGASR